MCAMMAAKIIRLPIELMLCRRAAWIHGHATNRIGDRFIVGAELLHRRGMSRRNGFHESVRVVSEFCQTALAAKIIRLIFVLMFPSSTGWIHGHTANRVGGHIPSSSHSVCRAS